MEGMIGEIKMFGGNFAPRSWALCQGQLLAISQNTALFSILGTTYGGDGRTTFGLPDFRGRVAVGEGAGPGLSQIRLGEKKGNQNTTLLVSNLPPHNHTMQANAGGKLSNDPNNKYLGAGDMYTSSAADKNLNADTIANTGSGQAFNNMQPYLGMNYIICIYGVFPSRN